MKFSANQNITYDDAVNRMFEILGTDKIMALASSLNDHVMVRNVSCLFYDQSVWFKTDKNFRKTKQLMENPHVAMCWNGIQIEGTAVNHGLVIDEPDQRFANGYKKYLWQSYNRYSHEDTEILIEVIPSYVEIWDTSDDGNAFQFFIDFDKKTILLKPYDN